MDALASVDDVVDVVKIQLSSLSTLITDSGYELACDQAVQELGWSFPISDSSKLLWIVKRSTRYALNILRIASAHKFKFKTVNLQHRYEHYEKLVKDMDAEFEEALMSNISLFAGIDTFKMFGTKIDAGFAYNDLGEDLTYNIEQMVNFSPTEND